MPQKKILCQQGFGAADKAAIQRVKVPQVTNIVPA